MSFVYFIIIIIIIIYSFFFFLNWATYFSFYFKLHLDVAISGNLLPEECEENTESYCALEHNVADRFGDQKSAENRRMRKEFQKVICEFVMKKNLAFKSK